jgi:D-alanyl-D-alanine carboxypeptidase/D-alanyl-D-alanine-endopeptidase (penicillin-binding protein 4)
MSTMPRPRWSTVVGSVVVLSLLAAPARAEQDLAPRIDAVLNRPEYRGGHWGVLVADARSGQALYRRNADDRFVPASSIKLYYAAAALAALGPDYRFETPVYARGRLHEGRLDGDLILVASGDPTLGGRDDGHGHLAYTDDDHTYANASGAQSEATVTDPLKGLKELARQVAAAGVRRVDGDVLVDDRLFARTPGNGNGPDWLTPIMVNDNLVDVRVRPGDRVGASARVSMLPATDYVRMESQVVTAAPGEPTWVAVQAAGPEGFVVRGQIAQDAHPLLRVYGVPDPTAFARALFVECLRREGVSVSASLSRPPQPDLPDPTAYARFPRVARFTSLPFSELLRVTMKVSSNVYANTFPLLIAARHGKRTMAEGLRLQRQVLADMGVDLRDISVATASGGTADDYLTPRAVVQLFQVLSRRPDYTTFLEALPVLGVDGTLADMVPPGSLARGKVHAKTGTFYVPESRSAPGFLRSKALAGTLTGEEGRTLFFAMFVNDVVLPHGVSCQREGRVLGHLCEILEQQGR